MRNMDLKGRNDVIRVSYATSFDALDLVSEQVIRPGMWPDANAPGFRGVYLGDHIN
jgi:hypothetical protein